MGLSCRTTCLQGPERAVPVSRAETPGETKQKKGNVISGPEPESTEGAGLWGEAGAWHVLPLSVAGGGGALGGVGAPGGGLCVVWGLWLRLAQG